MNAVHTMHCKVHIKCQELYKYNLKIEYYPFHGANVSLDTLLSANGRIFLLPSDFTGRVVCREILIHLYIIMILHYLANIKRTR